MKLLSLAKGFGFAIALKIEVDVLSAIVLPYRQHVVNVKKKLTKM